MGRAGRANETVDSYVFYLSQDNSIVPENFFERIPFTDKVISDVSVLNNDYGHICRRLTNGFNSKQQLLNNLLFFYKEEVISSQKDFIVKRFDANNLLTIKRYLYILYVMGYVQDWYSYSTEQELLISPKTKNSKETALQYFIGLGNNQNEILKIQRSTNLNAILAVYVEWYFSNFLYIHKEAFLDLNDFIINNHFSSSSDITRAIKSYYSLSYSSIKKAENTYLKASLQELISMVLYKHDKSVIADISRINGNEYNYNLDCTLFIDVLYNDFRIDENRLKRIVETSSTKQKSDFVNALESTYDEASTEIRMLILEILEIYEHEFGISFETWFEKYYSVHDSRCDLSRIFI